MKKFSLIILALITALLPLSYVRGQQQTTVNCGDWVTIKATAFEGFRFRQWSDGNTEAERKVKVTEDVKYTAFFEKICNVEEEWPVVVLYDWLIMIHVKQLNELGYFFNPEDVTWYQVVGEQDDLGNPDTWDDIAVATGYYLTLGQNLTGMGDYYARVDVSATSSGHLCSGYQRSTLIRYSSGSISGDDNMNAPSRAPKLMPSVAKSGEVIRLTNLEVNELTDITIYDPNGRRVSMMQTEGEHTVVIDTDFMPGCYLVKVDSPTGHFSLKFILSR